MSYSPLYALVVGHTFGAEGRIADRAALADPGGLTNMGVTQATLTDYRRRYPEEGMPVSVRDLTREQAMLIYYVDYWTPCRCEELPAYLALLTFDASVHHGPRRAIRWMQQAVDVVSDGHIGPLTIAAAWQADPKPVILTFVGERNAYLASRPHAKHNRGWFRRRIPELQWAATEWARGQVLA